ncbi:MAG: MFS transporter [Bdellovibrio sp.]|nr:MAG: MFS transporter [Bdellovibrio sp.]
MDRDRDRTQIPIADQRKIFGHPVGLYIIFFTEMWERFSYYGMRALLVLYMTKYLLSEADKGLDIFGYSYIRAFVEWFVRATGISDQLTTQIFSSQVYGLYTGFVYFTPLIGGALADQFWGQRRTVYAGAILMAIGHFLMAIESQFFVALLFLILGNGCFKPNTATQVGNLYEPGSPLRDRAYTIYYMGVNLGAFLSPLICGTLGQLWGWHYGFASAGVGMLLGLAIYHFGRRYLPPDTSPSRDTSPSKHDTAAKSAANSAATKTHFNRDEWLRVGALVFLCALNIVFWAIYEQQGNTLQLWADDKTDWNFFGWEMPSTWFQSFNSAFIFMFAPVLDRYWGWQNRKGSEPHAVSKMGIGCVLLGGSFIVMILAANLLPGQERGSVLWLVGSTWIYTIGELYLSPVGLSLVSKMSPPRIVSMMMGMWFLSSFVGNYLSGYIGSYYEIMSKEAFFTLLTGLGIAAGLVFFLVNGLLSRILSQPVEESLGGMGETARSVS